MVLFPREMETSCAAVANAKERNRKNREENLFIFLTKKRRAIYTIKSNGVSEVFLYVWRILFPVNILEQPLFFHPEINERGFTLSEEESRHIVSSLRRKEGDTLFITDGRGKLLKCTLASAHPKKAGVEVVEIQHFKRSPIFRRIAISPPKAGERLDWMLEKAVEIGVDEIMFLETRYSERDKLNLDRLQKIAISAMKQSKQVYLPALRGMVKWPAFMKEELSGSKLIAHLRADTISMNTALSTQSLEVTILIGPEGDFSEEEVEQAEQKGFRSISLGSNVLRTETAAIYALVCLNSFN